MARAYVAPFMRLRQSIGGYLDATTQGVSGVTRTRTRDKSTNSPAIAIALVGGVLYIGFAMYKELQRSRRLIGDQGAQLDQLKQQSSTLNELLSAQARSNKEIRDSLSLAVKLRSEYGRGVCLISGSFYFVEAGTGRPLRYPEAQTNESGAAVQNSDQPQRTNSGFDC